MTLDICWAWKIVLRLGIRRRMWDLHWRTRDKHRDSRLRFRRHLRWVHLCRHLHQRGRIDLSLDIRWALKIVLTLEIRQPSGDILGLDISRAWWVQVGLGLEICWGSILDDWGSLRYSCCNTPLALRWSVQG